MNNLNKVKVTVEYQKDLKTALVTISNTNDPNDVLVFQLQNQDLVSLYHQVTEAYELQQGKTKEQTIDVLNPQRSYVTDNPNDKENVTISSKLYRNFMHLDLKYRKLKQENHVLLVENRKLKQQRK